MENGRTEALSRLRALALMLGALALTSCAVGGDGLEGLDEDGGREDGGQPWSASGSDGGGAVGLPDTAPMSGFQSDGGGLFGGLDGVFGGGASDGGSTAPVGDAGENPEGWTLNSDSAKECPALPPPIPIVGGLCVGIYFTCGWTNAKGAKYSCTCDWIHWLCI